MTFTLRTRITYALIGKRQKLIEVKLRENTDLDHCAKLEVGLLGVLLIGRKDNVAIEWFQLLLRIGDVSASNIDPKTTYLDWGFSWFSSELSG
jgi:hypothetical protein